MKGQLLSQAAKVLKINNLFTDRFSVYWPLIQMVLSKLWNRNMNLPPTIPSSSSDQFLWSSSATNHIMRLVKCWKQSVSFLSYLHQPWLSAEVLSGSRKWATVSWRHDKHFDTKHLWSSWNTSEKVRVENDMFKDVKYAVSDNRRITKTQLTGDFSSCTLVCICDTLHKLQKGDISTTLRVWY